jgi:hypothetical protein
MQIERRKMKRLRRTARPPGTHWPFIQQKATFPPCTTPYCKEKNIAHTHSTERCYKLHPPKGKGSPAGGRHSFLVFKGKGKGKGTGKGKGKGKQGKGKGNRKGKEGKGKEPRGLVRTFDDTCHFCKQPGHFKAQCPKYAALSNQRRLMVESELNCRTTRCMYTISWKTL